MEKKKSILIVAAIVVVVVVAGLIATNFFNKEDKYPSRDINMVVPWNPGGSTDLTGRALADAMGKNMGCNIVVTNTPGSGGSVGTLTVMKAEKDGYNILANGMLSLSTLPVLGYADTTPKDWDFYLATFTPNVLAVRKDSPYQTAQDLLDAMKANPGEITDGTGGMGSGGHVGIEVLCATTGLQYKHVPYEGGGKAVTAALAGEVDFTSQLLVEMQDMFISGDMRALANFSAEDITLENGTVIPSILKVVPELADRLPMGETTGIAVPKGQPEYVTAALSKSFSEALQNPDFLAFCKTKGFLVNGMQGEEAAAYMDKLSSTVTWTLYDCGVATISPEKFGISR
ncbi:tripartite tricarboxylate transporter substrate binding protein [Marasmitruncus massiliensis]|uniref:tripartite tricarboxylate transporter substrate binding protein n=1 Tax=Marasmitruncus massiliensis TaxID=1944642 RepID=UPI000C7ABBA2|nr:tripartite tricarboxylate transporter substrate binding protein [Marasmitruncus massiliensis]MBE6906471.1 tripartite tricarboxylate transporter substrate binding protein [Oscillospiraceae bacterium]